MPRQVRIQYPWAMYHVMNRGNRRQEIYLDDIDRQDFLKTLAEAGQTAWHLYAYCLMRGHSSQSSLCLLATVRKQPPGRQPNAAWQSKRRARSRLDPFYMAGGWDNTAKVWEAATPKQVVAWQEEERAAAR